ncbi:hypothetical protein [Streptomyces hirsutus]|uniref:hypothetical protein n=1 Tax=Streptomyces hirsutus TaxID=35620 RepID=UPI003676E943
MLNRPHSVTVDVDLPAGAEGVLICQGTDAGGWTLFIKDGRLRYTHNYVRRALYRLAGADPVPEGRHELRFEFKPAGEPDIQHGKGTPGKAQLYIDRQLAAETDLPVTTSIMFNPGGLTCGRNPGSAVDPDYISPFPFTGVLRGVTVDLSGELITDMNSEMRMHMARQ